MRISRRRSLFASCLFFTGLSAASLVLMHCYDADSLISQPQFDAGSDSTTPDSATPDSATPDSATPADAGVYPLIVGHRGASGYRPEHTIAAYELAIAMGADFIEPDVVSTKDGVLVVRHENEISGTTDVASHPEFADRQKTKTIDGVPSPQPGWWTEDFTLAELKTLRARERLPRLRPANTAFDGLFEIPTLQEVIDLAKSRGVGIYPETKHPTYFRSIGLPLEEKVAQLLRDAGWHETTDPVFLQSFEPQSLQKLKELTNLKRVQLLNGTGKPYDFVVSNDPRTYADLVKPEGLAFIATFAQGIGPSKDLLIPRDANQRLLAPTTAVDDAHKAGLLVHPFTFRNENVNLPADFRVGAPDDAGIYDQARGDAPAEYRRFFSLGIDGLFSDFADTAVATRRQVYGR